MICGEESSDSATGQVLQSLAECLDWPQLTLRTASVLDLFALTASGRRSIHGGYELLEVPLSCVVSVKSACNEPRFIYFRLKAKAGDKEAVTYWDEAALHTEPECTGLTGSPTAVPGLAEASTRQRRGERVTGSPEEIATKLAELIRICL